MAGNLMEYIYNLAAPARYQTAWCAATSRGQRPAWTILWRVLN